MQAYPRTSNFGADAAFLTAHTQLLVLTSEDGLRRIAVSPTHQGRVFTSSYGGELGPSCGYVHREGVARCARQPHMTVVGGEDRFWLGPEGGQYGLYFPPGSPFTYESWQVPEALDWGAWPVVRHDSSSVAFQKNMEVTNWSGVRFPLEVRRTVRLLDETELEAALGAFDAGHLDWVGFRSDNCIINRGDAAWTRERGLLSIWILGMYPAGARTTIVLPYRAGPESQRGPVFRDDYFGPISPDRLEVRDGALLFRADACKRGKLGLPARRARPAVGSYDPEARILTLVQYTGPFDDATYLDSRWRFQRDPYAGDVVHGYNDGPVSPSVPGLGDFYELETSSPALPLAPGALLQHTHRTFHLHGAEADLDRLATRVLGVSLRSLHGESEGRPEP